MDDRRITEEVTAAVATATGCAPRDLTDTESSLWDLGVDSLSLLELTRRLEKQFQVTIPDEETGRTRTLGDLIRTIQRLAGEGQPAGHDQEGPS
ncbi:phosphopantetheine-binding protein [Streptosporangium sp. NPDC048047]|uniref:acyl carrier protein n=1 Tax=Streptosporangium sp. NPDC048047 TaxID=3155748 RepID=UPI003445753C